MWDVLCHFFKSKLFLNWTALINIVRPSHQLLIKPFPVFGVKYKVSLNIKMKKIG